MFEGENLRCRRGGRVVFDGFRFALAPGAALLLVGPNGSGKSSLLRLMAGLARPERGALTWDGMPIADNPEAHAARLHYVGHLDAVKPALTVRRNLALWEGLRETRHPSSTGDDPDPVDGALERFGLFGLAALPARLLSAGQRRRLALARLLAAPAPLWLLDEPSVALDRDSVAALLAAIAAHRAAGGICVAATNVDLAIPGAESLDLTRFAAADLEPAW